jgi:glycosyltransferase involved in cell wall biosynthesis
MREMKIWNFGAYDQPKGQSSRTYDYSRELVKRGHQVTMFTSSYCHFTHEERLAPHEKWRIEEIDGIRVVWLRTIHYTGNGWKRGMNMLSNAWRSLQVVRTISEKPDVVIGASVPIMSGWAASRIARLKDAAFVFEVRDVWPVVLVDDGALSRMSPVYYFFRLIEKYLYRRSARICATMPFLHQHVSESGGNPDKVTWIPNGVNLERYSGLKPYEGGGKLPLVAMYVGGFGNAHDVITIVRSASILQQKGNNKFRFVLVGDGVKQSECKREALLNKLSNIEFRDPVAKSDVPQLQMGSDIQIACVLDSPAYRFGLNLNKLFDYFASGRPVIFSGNAPNDPVAESGAGFSIPPEDPEAMVGALEKYLEMSTAERIEMGKRGRRYVEKEFDIRILADRMESLLLQAIQDRESIFNAI